jgi:hypothetical protein
MSGAEQDAWADEHGVEILPDHLNRPSVDVETAYRLRAEADAVAERHLTAEREAAAAHAAAVAELRDRLAEAFVAAAGGSSSVSTAGVVSLRQRNAADVAAGLEAARDVWAAAPPEVAVEVWSVAVEEGDTLTSYDLGTVLPRGVVESGIVRAVARANKAAAAVAS